MSLKHHQALAPSGRPQASAAPSATAADALASMRRELARAGIGEGGDDGGQGRASMLRELARAGLRPDRSSS